MTDRLTDAELDALDAVLGLPQQYDWHPDILTVHAECRYQDYSNGPDSSVVRDDGGEVVAVLDYDAGGDYVARLAVAAHGTLPALLAEVREHRAREAARRAALDALVDGDGR
ncbi:hypothetical protein ACH0CA_01360 [Kytococcus sedentarius]|uniref:hypothetical protein n=1 Tax=Kytococcus sedentarius TaxID=1276 RepID=UPI0038793EDC